MHLLHLRQRDGVRFQFVAQLIWRGLLTACVLPCFRFILHFFVKDWSALDKTGPEYERIIASRPWAAGTMQLVVALVSAVQFWWGRVYVVLTDSGFTMAKLRSEYNTHRECKRWYMPMFYFVLDATISQTVILFRMQGRDAHSTPLLDLTVNCSLTFWQLRMRLTLLQSVLWAHQMMYLC